MNKEDNPYIYRGTMESFKRGLADALLVGTKSDNQSTGYKQGYDYGIYLWCELNPEEEEVKDD